MEKHHSFTNSLIHSFIIVAIASLTLASCNNEEPEPEPAIEFTFDIADLTQTEAKVTVIPSITSAEYVVSFDTEVVLKNYSDAKAYIEAKLEGKTYEQMKTADKIFTGARAFSYNHLEPFVDYCVVAARVDENLQVVETPYTLHFSTLAKPPVTFTLSASDITFQSAKITVTPSENDEEYCWFWGKEQTITSRYQNLTDYTTDQLSHTTYSAMASAGRIAKGKQSISITNLAAETKLLFVVCQIDKDLHLCGTPASVKFTTLAAPGAEGYLSGIFTVDANGKKVRFAKGNLMYRAGSYKTWRFAEHQWDFVGDAEEGTVYQNGTKCDNLLISDTYTGWIDLFGWGTGNTPTNSSENDADYPATFVDWGQNPISNGGNYGGLWRTLTRDEWYHLFCVRPNAIRRFGFGHIKIAATGKTVNGMFILPDTWTCPSGSTFYTANEKGVTWDGSEYWLPDLKAFDNNEYIVNTTNPSADTWTVMENSGVVFLPAGGSRTGTKRINQANGFICYHASTPPYTYNQCFGIFYNKVIFSARDIGGNSTGNNVRLVNDVP